MYVLDIHTIYLWLIHSCFDLGTKCPNLIQMYKLNGLREIPFPIIVYQMYMLYVTCLSFDQKIVYIANN